MDHTLTIVARRPSCTDPLDTDAAIDEQDLAIELMMTKLRARTDKAAHAVYRASTLKQLVVCRQLYQKSVGGPPALLQLVGHAYPGALSLGAHWAAGAPPPAHDAYVLDSNPNAYAILKTQFAPTGEVRVLGCDLADPTQSPVALADGPTLIFALSRLWGVPVRGALTTISDADFDALGLFARPERLAVASGLAVTLPAP